ncbi:MAG: TolC family protein [Acidobacteriota bacterium]
MKTSIKYFALLSLVTFGGWRATSAQTPMPVHSLQPAQRGQQAQLDLASPLTLDRVLARFLERNLAVEAGRYRVEGSRAEQIAARLRPNPSLTVSTENIKVNGNSPFTVPFARLYEAGPTYTQTIELGGKRQRRIEVADMTVSVAEAELADVLRLRLFGIRRAFYEALLAGFALELIEEQRRYFGELVQLNQVRLEEGAIAGSDLLKVKLERLKFDSAVSQARLALRQAGIRLLELLNEPDLEKTVTVAGQFDAAPVMTDIVALREKALRNRPDLQSAQRSVTLAERRISLEHARGVPDLTPFAGYKRVGVDNTVLFGVTIPLRISNRNQAEIARAVADEKIATAERQLVHNRVLAEVESAWRAYETARAQMTTFERDLLPQADESREIAQVAYREGATDLLPLLEAQRTRVEIRQQYLRAQFDYRVSILQLEAAIGEEITP